MLDKKNFAYISFMPGKVKLLNMLKSIPYKTMKLKYILTIFIFTFFAFAACKDYVDYITTDKAFTLSFPRGFKKAKSNNEADLQCISKDNAVQMVFFSYRTEDLAETADSETLINMHVEDMASKRKNFTKVEEEYGYVTNGKMIRKAVYSGVKDNLFRDYYIFSAVNFYDNPDVVLTAIQVVPVSKYKTNKDIMQSIIESAKVNK